MNPENSRMKDRRPWKFTALVFIAMVLVTPGITHGQEVSLGEGRSAVATPAIRNVIVIGFVGGFVSQNDTKHPEVQFASYLRDRYPFIHAEVFGNHMGERLSMRSCAYSIPTTMAFSPPLRRSDQPSSSTDTVGEQRRQSHSPVSWGRWIFRWRSPSR